jgi:NADH-ubiquinone oxidoreductase chain 4
VSQLILLLLLESILIVVFTSLDLITFYVSFEAVLIPLFIIIVLHGSTEGRIRASMLLFMYTLTGSFFMLLSIIKLYSVGGTSDMLLLSIIGPEFSPEIQR